MANQPEDTLRDGNLKATTWKNQGDKGAFFSITLTRSYQDEAGEWHESDSFSVTQLLRIAHLAGRAYDRVAELRHQERANDVRQASMTYERVALPTGGPLLSVAVPQIAQRRR